MNKPSIVERKPLVVDKPIVLVVEDNPDNMITMKALLAENYTVLEAIDGNGGIEIAKKLKPHLS